MSETDDMEPEDQTISIPTITVETDELLMEDDA